MIGILLTKLRLLMRHPWPVLGIIVINLGFAYLVGKGNDSQISVPVYSVYDNIEEHTIWNKLIDSDIFVFEQMPEEKVKRLVSEGKVDAGLELKDDTFELMIVTKTENTYIIYQYVQSVYDEMFLLEQMNESANTQPGVHVAPLKKTLSTTNNEPLFSIQTNDFRDGKTAIIDSQLQAIFGFSLFFVIYTIAYNVLPILEEKNNGVWDRMIISPIRKWEMYTGNLLYSFIVGYIQVVIVYLFFYYVIEVNFYGGFGKSLLLLIPYVFSIVALSMLITGLVKNSSQFNAVIPLISVSMAMIGGAYWPLEIVSSKVLLAISKFVPITYSMESLKMATVYGHTTGELMLPTSILFLMGVIMMGIGIHLMERKQL